MTTRHFGGTAILSILLTCALLGPSGCAAAGGSDGMSNSFQTWVRTQGLSTKGTARQGPEAIYVPDLTQAPRQAVIKGPVVQPASLPLVFLDGSGDKPDAPTTLRLHTSDGVLYLDFKCSDPDVAHLVYASQGRDSDRLWRDDVVEVLLRPDGREGPARAHFIVNAIGGLYDAKIERGKADASWDPPVRCSTSITPTGWTASLAIPLRALVPTGDVPRVWRGNIVRIRQGRRGAFAEETGWRSTGRVAANVPEKFGRLYFEAVEKGRNIPPAGKVLPPPSGDIARIKDAKRLERILRGNYDRPAVVAATSGKGAAFPLASLTVEQIGAVEPTTAYVARSADALTLTIECAEPDPKSVVATKRPRSLWTEDSVEVFLAPHRKESPTYVQISVNAAGVTKTNRGRRGGPVRGVKTEVKVGRKAWTVRIEVPFASLGLTGGQVPALWGMNLIRNRPSRPGQAQQYSVWSRFSWSSHAPATFGTLWLPDADILPDLGDGAALAKLAKRGATAAAGPAAPTAPAAVAKFDWDVFSPGEAKELDLPRMVHRLLDSVRDKQFAERDAMMAKVKTWQDWLKVRAKIREGFEQSVGAFPRKPCALRPRVRMAFENDDIRVEALVYESRPNFFVSANCFIPKRRNRRKLPTVVRIVGHSTRGRLSGGVVRQGIDLAYDGYFVISIDALGQGERIYVNSGIGSRTPTRNHYGEGEPLLLNGYNLAGLMMYDIMRGIDYLETRPEVDIRRVVLTGSSGGGTVTSYVSAMEDRLFGAAPISCNGSFRRGRGTYDSEQCLWGNAHLFIDPEGRTAGFAPRPLTLISEVSSPEHEQRNRDAYRTIDKVYALAGAQGKYEYVPTPGPHGYGSRHYRLFRKWLAATMPPNSAHPKPTSSRPRLSSGILNASAAHRVFFSRDLPKSESIAEVNVKLIKRSLSYDAKVRSAAAATKRSGEVRQAVAKLLGLTDGRFKPLKATSVSAGKLAGLAFEKLHLETDPGVFVPAVLLKAKPAGGKPAPAVVWIDQRGKRLLMLHRWRQARKLVDAGVSVLVADIRAIGETAMGGDTTFHGAETSLNGFGARFGTPVIGMRVRDAICCMNYLRSRKDVDPARVGIVGSNLTPINPAHIRQHRLMVDPGLEDLHRADSLGPAVALLAHVLDEKSAACGTSRALASYTSVCEGPYFYHPNATFPRGILQVCDVEDLVAAAAPRPVVLAGSINGRNQRLDQVGEAGKYFRAAARVYGLAGAAATLKIAPAGDVEDVVDFIGSALSGK